MSLDTVPTECPACPTWEDPAQMDHKRPCQTIPPQLGNIYLPSFRDTTSGSSPHWGCRSTCSGFRTRCTRPAPWRSSCRGRWCRGLRRGRTRGIAFRDRCPRRTVFSVSAFQNLRRGLTWSALWGLCQGGFLKLKMEGVWIPYHFAHDEAAVLLADLDAQGEVGRAGSSEADGLQDDEKGEGGLHDGQPLGFWD